MYYSCTTAVLQLYYSCTTCTAVLYYMYSCTTAYICEKRRSLQKHFTRVQSFLIWRYYFTKVASLVFRNNFSNTFSISEFNFLSLTMLAPITEVIFRKNLKGFLCKCEYTIICVYNRFFVPLVYTALLSVPWTIDCNLLTMLHPGKIVRPWGIGFPTFRLFNTNIN